MADTFENFVRSGRLQKNFDDAVEKACDEARQRGLRGPVEPALPASTVPTADADSSAERCEGRL
jgi:hypothetical protein